MTETTTPMLPCPSVPEILAFYRALGFDVTFEQTQPNPYAVVQRGAIDLHFFGMRRHDPAASYGTCLISTDDVDGMHQAFRSGLKAAYGRVPTRGIPRIGPLRDTTYGVRQFLVTDPGGNCLRIGQPNGDSVAHGEAPTRAFARALHLAALLGDAKGDHRQAARLLDRALAAADAAEAGSGAGSAADSGADVSDAAADAAGVRPSAVELLAALVLRADMAIRLDQPELARTLLGRAAEIVLTEADRVALRDALHRADELREELGSAELEGEELGESAP
ncbi:bleomycin resistance protein [Streptomyces zagrosensis]|uniref:Catechol 2,3-dioxygenase-like lactoylglutathione lyase family enzyme n=1 Tax=Streptomyces zagrosensis TaxID=1042984 RepID=A0A7W9V2J5_9ACTN|nr:VOC family protein [Streptomyces zagrosensis]MBB5939361.1 catechol 2,3-dioxygenase-like lactoylglutathione lyase family enzyme [Streptomyces zagrosensis]